MKGNLLKTAALELQVKDIDTVGRRVKVALSKFGVIDSDREVMERGAFKKSIQERGPESQANRKIKFLRYHNQEHEIGKWISLTETHDYLIGLGDLGRSTKGNDAFLDYQDGIITEHSVGFYEIPDKIFMTADGYKVYREVGLMEGSAVTFGAVDETPVFDVSKSADIATILRIKSKIDAYENAAKNGQGTDERLICIEKNLTTYKNAYNSLLKIEPPSSASGTQFEKPNDSFLNFQNFI